MPDNRITLSSDRTDIYGQPLAAIHWSPGSRDCENLTRAADAFERMWNASPFAKLGALIRRPAGEAEAELARGSGIYHPGGTTRFAQRPEDGVVDTDLRLFGLQDVRVVSTSVLPSGGGANPTMMLLMLAFRCVADIRTSLAANRDDMPRNAKASDIADQESQPCRL